MKKIIITIIVLVLIGLAIWKFGGAPVGQTTSSTSSTTYSSQANSKHQLAPVTPESLTETYTDKNYAFAFKYPKGYVVTTFPDTALDNANIVLVQNNSTSVGFQIHIQPIDEDISVLTLDRIKKDLPDMVINNPQDVILGAGSAAGKGVAFMSDDPSFDGASREVWFVFKKNLYQIRTYAAYDPLVQAVLGKWEFK